MKLVNDYLKFIQSEYGYANPIQTRPKPKPGITGEDPDKPLPPGVIGPSGSQIDLDNETDDGYDFRNFSQANYGENKNEKKNKKNK